MTDTANDIVGAGPVGAGPVGAGTVVAADTIVAGGHVLSPGWVMVSGTRITGVGAGVPPAGQGVERLRGTLVPGFVDIHTHGAGRADFADAADGAITAALDWHVGHGATTILASLATAPLDETIRRASALGALVGTGPLRGVHLEGPFLSPGHRGAHNVDLLRTPTPADVDMLLAAGSDIRMVTIAPELPGAIAAIERMVNAGVVAAVGHTSGTQADARRGFDAGATVATHLFNGMPPLHHREPGPVGAALLDERVLVELILDGRHLSDGIVQLVLAQAGGRAAAVSDSIAATGAADGEYELAGTRIVVEGGVATTIDTGSLAGSTRTLDTAFAAMVQRYGATLPEAVAATSTSAARALGFDDVGDLAVGMTADLVLLDDDLAVARVMTAGAWVAPAR